MADKEMIAVGEARHREMLTSEVPVRPGVGGGQLRFVVAEIGRLLGANLNTTADQAIPIAATNYRITEIIASDPSTGLALSLAAGGIYTEPSKGGVAVVSAAQLYTALSSAVKILPLALANTDQRTATTLYLSLTLAHGSAATINLRVYGQVFD